MATLIRPFRSLKRPRPSGLVIYSPAVNSHSLQSHAPFYHFPRRCYATEQPPRSTNPVLDQYLETVDMSPTATPQGRDTGVRLSTNSVFKQIIPTVGLDGVRSPGAMAVRLDPKPTQRRRWLRNKVIQEIRKRGRVTKTLKIKRTERQLLLKSDFWKTSVKKLVPLARQIQGKTIEDALAQMQFSKKKYAAHIRSHLVAARDKAVVQRGMGLGLGREPPKWIKLKDGTMHRVQDKTSIYVDQAWVGRGTYGYDLAKRGRHRMDTRRLPQACISVLLKEETTRIRLHEEAKEKKLHKKPWLQLPDRPIPGQQPYYSW